MPKTTMFDVLSPHPEPSSLVAFAGNRIDRQSEHRPDDCVEQALKSDNVHAFAFARGRLALKHEDQVLDPLFAPFELLDMEPDWENAILLGYGKTGEPRVAVPVGIDPDQAVDHLKFADGRTLMREELINDGLLGQFAQASSLLTWNRSVRHCGRCGAETRMEAGGYRRRCTSCDTQFFPRTDPVVIMLTIDAEGDRALLGRSPHFNPGMYSCLAGFLEPGETIEQAVRRETFEESGIEVGAVRYHASQPWPMPHSLMIGCYGHAESLDIKRDETELEDCRWFTREDVRRMIEGTHPEGINVPVSGAVAYRIIQDWVDWPEWEGEAVSELEKEREARLTILKKQEQMSQFQSFSEEIAFDFGSVVYSNARSKRSAVVVNIRTTDRTLFHAAMPGATPDNDEWVRRKSNVVLRYHVSSLQFGDTLALKGRVINPDMGIDMMNFAAHGGAFPIRVKKAGVVAVVTVSGLPQLDDHRMIIDALDQYLKIDMPKF